MFSHFMTLLKCDSRRSSSEEPFLCVPHSNPEKLDQEHQSILDSILGYAKQTVDSMLAIDSTVS